MQYYHCENGHLYYTGPLAQSPDVCPHCKVRAIEITGQQFDRIVLWWGVLRCLRASGVRPVVIVTN